MEPRAQLMRRWARALDRINVRVVRWRLAQDPGAVAGLTLPTLSPMPEPRRDATHSHHERRQRWVVHGHDWVADRCLPPAPGTGSAALILLHGWLATPLHLSYLRWRLRPLLRAGIEVWLPRLPGHIERTPPGSVSGVRCLSGPPAATSAAIERGVAETLALGAWLRGRREHVALWGISLGGWIAALAAAREAEWSAVVLWSPVVDPRCALRSSPLAEPLRALHGRTSASAGDLFDDHEGIVPIECARRVREDRVLVVCGREDNVARRASIETFCRRWSVQSLELEHGHISQMMSPLAWRCARKFVIERCERP